MDSDGTISSATANGVARKDSSKDGITKRIGRSNQTSSGPVGDSSRSNIGLRKLIAIRGESRLGDGGELGKSSDSPNVEAPRRDRKGGG